MANDNKTPHAFFYKFLENYNTKTLTTMQEIVVYEYLLMQGKQHQIKRHAQDFYHSMRQFVGHLRLREHTIKQVLNKLENMGYISTQTKGTPATMHYAVDFKWLSNNLTKIYTAEGAKEYKEYFDDLYRKSQF